MQSWLTIGSLIAWTAPSSPPSTVLDGIISWWWSVSNSLAMMSENSNSSPSRSPTRSKPMLKVCRPC